MNTKQALGFLGRTLAQTAWGVAAGAVGVKDVPSLFGSVDPLAPVWTAHNTLTAKAEDGNRRAPVLISNRETATGRHLIYTLPPGLAPSTVLGNLELLGATLKGECEAYWKDYALHVFSYEGPLPERIQWTQTLADNAAGLPVAFVVGESRAGTEVLDLAKGPLHHLLVGGLPGMGKSAFMRQTLASLHHLHTPQELRLHLVDMKGGVEFYAFSCSALVESFATAPAEVAAVLRDLNDLINDRMGLFAHAGVENLAAYNKRNDPLPYHLVAIDELAELPDTAAPSLTRLLRLARFAGVHILAATQRPDRETVPGQMKATIGATLAFRVRNEVNSRILLGEGNDRAAFLPPLPGRGIFQGMIEREIQAPFISLEEAQTLAGKHGKPKEHRKW